jgi:hypothetical protein
LNLKQGWQENSNGVVLMGKPLQNLGFKHGKFKQGDKQEKILLNSVSYHTSNPGQHQASACSISISYSPCLVQPSFQFHPKPT